MPWKIKTIVGERMKLVRALLRGEESVAQNCRLWGVSRKSAYKWRRRFLEGGRAALEDRPRRPHHSPRRTKQHWREAIERLRQSPGPWGAKKIRRLLLGRGKRPPCERTIARWLKRLHLVPPGRRRPPKACLLAQPKPRAARRPNHIWTIDFKGWFRTGDGRRVEPLTVRDSFSRYVLAVRLLPDQRWQPVRAVLAGLFRRHGLPRIIRCDNGAPFASTGAAGLSRLSAWWVRLGIRAAFTRPAHPQDNGAHEQMHRVYKRDTLRPPARTPRGQQHRSTTWRHYYNHKRPHEGLGQKMPARKYRPSPRRWPRRLPALAYPKGRAVRHVRSNGQIKWRGQKRFIGEAFVGQPLGLKPIGPGVQAVYFSKLLIGHLHEKDAGAMRPTVYERKRKPRPKPKV